MADGTDEGEGRRWLTPDAVTRAVAALKRRREEAGVKWNELAEDPKTGEKFWDIARSKTPLDWTGLAPYFRRSLQRGSRSWRGANDLAAHLLRVNVSAITTTEAPEESGPVQTSEGLRVSYPKTIANHTAVILGHLPDGDADADTELCGAIFVKPRDDEDAWYPQCEGKHNPLRVGRAFACLAHFGNPDFVSHHGDPPAFDVEVHALSVPWPHGSDRLTAAEMRSRIADLRPVGKKAFSIQRISPVQEMTLTDAQGSVLWAEGLKTIPFDTEIVLSWKGQPEATIEVREGLGDKELLKQPVRSPLTLTVGAPRSPVGAKLIKLKPAKKGLYRVKLYPLKHTFVDPPYEWWLQAKAPQDEPVD